MISELFFALRSVGFKGFFRGWSLGIIVAGNIFSKRQNWNHPDSGELLTTSAQVTSGNLT